VGRGGPSSDGTEKKTQKEGNDSVARERYRVPFR
jgi:hypothetical protein